MSASEADREAVHAQLGRTPRGDFAVAHRCDCGLPDVVATPPVLDDGTPFPTTFYLTCPRASSRIGTLEAGGVMKEMTARLESDEQLREEYDAAHRDYLQRRAELGDASMFGDTSAGGMPTRVKCLHVLLGHALAAGPGVNPLGDEVRDLIGDYAEKGPCVCVDQPNGEGQA